MSYTRPQSLFWALFLTLTALAGPAMAAGECSPVPGGSICVNKTCATVGATTIDSDQKNIIACLKNDSGALVWKSTSGTTSGSCNVSITNLSYSCGNSYNPSVGTVQYTFTDKQVVVFPCSAMPAGVYYQFTGTNKIRCNEASMCGPTGEYVYQCNNGTINFLFSTCKDVGHGCNES